MTAAVLAGLGAVVPDRVVTNAMLAERMDTSDEWIRTRTGIRERRHVDPGTSTGDLACEAGRRALKSAGTEHVDAVVLATTTPDHPCPATAPTVAARLGLGTVPAYDVAAVCTGFLYALASAAGLIALGTARQVLVIGAETYSTIVDPDDRTTAPIFGDGAGAVVLRAGEPDEPGVLRDFVLGSDGDLADLIVIPGNGARQRTSGRPAEPGDEYFAMQGKAVYVNRRPADAGVVDDRPAPGRLERRLGSTGWSVTRPTSGSCAASPSIWASRPRKRSSTSTGTATPRPRPSRWPWRRRP